jgi:hypothetical protein
VIGPILRRWIRAVMVGGLSDANRFDAGTPVYNKAMTAAELQKALGLS